MKDSLENKLSSFQKVQNFLTTHAADLSAIPAVADLKDQLDIEVNEVLDSAAASSTDITGYTTLKQNKRNALTTAILKVSAAMQGYYAVNELPHDLDKVNKTFSHLNYLRDNDLFTYAMQISELATPLGATLAPFGATASDITALELAHEDFLKFIQEPRAQIGHRSAQLTNLSRQIDEVDNLLRYKLDHVMRIFQVTNPVLYDEYRLARSIDDTGSTTAPDYEGSAPVNELTLIATIPFLAGRTFKVRNVGTVPFTFGLGTESNAFTGTPILIEPGAEVQRLSSALGDAASHVLIDNEDPTQAALYEIRIEE